MKNNVKRIIAAVLCAVMTVSLLPLSVFSVSVDDKIEMTAGEIIYGFAADAISYFENDAEIAFINDSGDLCALKAGETVIEVTDQDWVTTEYTVTVFEYDDGSPVVGNLKLLARYNDSMAFYDGHVYLLFTSYQDGVTIAVDDLYAGYELSDWYYADINEDISYGSNHTGSYTDDYFTFRDDMTAVTLDRGQIVTIGMYRGFDLSIPEVALGAIGYSSVWSELEAAGKTAVVESILSMVFDGKLSLENALVQLLTLAIEIKVDPAKFLDGEMSGGVCFNRELYNQKLEWDQYDNVTYELDITENQLNALVDSLSGNLNRFSLFNNSCATVALRAWNAALGYRDGDVTSYYLDPQGEGILSIMDAPKTVREEIEIKLPGCYINDSYYVEEPDAGFEDETGWVYVSAPEKVSPLTLNYTVNNGVLLDTDKTKPSELIKAVKGDKKIVYNKDGQIVDIAINTTDMDGAVFVNKIDLDINGEVITADENTEFEEGIWLKVALNWEDDEGLYDYYVVDADGNVLPSEYDGEYMSFLCRSVPQSFKIVKSTEGSLNILQTTVINEDNAGLNVYVYYYDDNGEKVILDDIAEVYAGTVVYVYVSTDYSDFDHCVTSMTLNGWDILEPMYFDEDENAYGFDMEYGYVRLRITYERAEFELLGHDVIQMLTDDCVDLSEYVRLTSKGRDITDKLMYFYYDYVNDESSKKYGSFIYGEKETYALVMVFAPGNAMLGKVFLFEIYDDYDDLVKITYSDDIADKITVGYSVDGAEGHFYEIPYSGYMIPKGSPVRVNAAQNDGTVISLVNCNVFSFMSPYEIKYIYDDTNIIVTFTEAEITGMPNSVHLDSEDDTYQLDLKTKYKGVLSLIPVYDDTIYYRTTDPLITVDKNGLITVTGEIPEGGASAYVIATAGYSNGGVYAYCKVTLGDYDGDRIVGSATIYACSVRPDSIINHSSFVFTTYEDVDLDISYYRYDKPTQKMIDLLRDYYENPENYPSDPVLYSDEIELDDREAYFEKISGYPEAEPETISLKAGETISISNAGYGPVDLEMVLNILACSPVAQTESFAKLIGMSAIYKVNGTLEGPEIYDSFFETLAFIHDYNEYTGGFALDGIIDGGRYVNREMYNQFAQNYLQTPNNYYTVEITADELAMLKLYLADPDENYYSAFGNNCAFSTAVMWNIVTFDRPELNVNGNLTGLASDPFSLYFELLYIRLFKKDLDGEGGTDFYPRPIDFDYYEEEDESLKYDINGDGKVNNKDVVALFRYVSDDDVDVVLSRLDVNGDGKANNKDVVALFRIVSE